jgi:hypothetical protein
MTSGAGDILNATRRQLRTVVGALLVAAAVYAVYLLYWQTCDLYIDIGGTRLCVRERGSAWTLPLW